MRKRRTKDSGEALFRAAFLSYQSQDYDGAFRKFERFRKLYPRSWRSRDAMWHMAWLRYLRSDYKGAIVLSKKSRKGKTEASKVETLSDVSHQLLAGHELSSLGAKRRAASLLAQVIKKEPYSC